MTKRSWLLIIVIVLLAQAVTRLPDLIRAQPPAGKWYTGQASWFDPWDINVYLGAIGWGQRDGLLFANLFDTQPTPSMPIYTIYTLVGRLWPTAGFSPAVIFHLSGFITTFILATVVWWFLKIFLSKKPDRLLAFFLILLGGGLGWLFWPKIILPDLGQPGFTLASALQRPHEAISLCLFLLTLGYFWLFYTNRGIKNLIIGSIACFIMLFFHPYSVLPLGLIIVSAGFYWWLKTDSRTFLTTTLALGITGGVYILLVGKNLLANPSFSGLSTQVQSSPSPVAVILGWGVLFPLYGFTFFNKNDDNNIVFLKIWLVVHFLAIYLPFGFQKLLIRGLWIPIVLLAVNGIPLVIKKVGKKYSLLIFIMLASTCFSTLFISFKRITETSENRWLYLTDKEGEAINYLKTHGGYEEGVLASYRLANIIPAHTAKRVFAGHEFQTPHFNERINQVNQFYAGKMSSEAAKTFLASANIDWVFWGPDEKAIGNLKIIPYQDLLTPVIENEIVSLYQTNIK